MKPLAFVSSVVLFCGSIAGCKTTSPKSAALASDSQTEMRDLPLLKFETLDVEMVKRIAEYGRAEAQAMFAAKGFLHLIAFDNLMDQGPCSGVLGARIIYANGDLEHSAARPYAMVTLNPRVNGFGNCGYETASSVKTASDVSVLVNDTRNFENEFEAFNGLKLGANDALKKIRQKYSKMSGIVGLSLLSPAVPGMAKDPWLMVVGDSCGSRALVYVNLSTGDLLEGPRGVKSGC